MADTYKYDPSNPHTRYNPKDPVDSALMNKMSVKERGAWMDEKIAYDKAQRENKKPAPVKTPVKAPEKEVIPSDIADQLQTSKNERAAKAYDKRRATGDDYKKGGAVKSKASSRADGCAQRGKTKGRMV